ncbi:MAG TPA: VWA domain-containing protein [Thermoanaerobaculia bacterium]|nr:VWA domain-containing protein [Thermoanaerobaculia bacterium]HUM31121.1 VWA domain-containing protein [Thermoanaerobaculia bacterium]HXK69480.1 VWA domain-containing protein [Thermoanaerobaculia bacterium]
MIPLLLLTMLFAPSGDLADKYRQFLEHDALYLITTEEREAFDKLQDDPQRDLFIDEFWKRRDTFPDTARNEFKEAYLERLDEAEETWGLRDPRSRFYALFGPAERIAVNCPNIYQPIEVWHYAAVSVIKGDVWILFYQPYGFGSFALWEGFDDERELLSGEAAGEICFERIYVQRALAWTAQAWHAGDFQALISPPPVDLENLKDIFTATTYLEPGLQPVTFDLDLDYRPTYGPKVEVRGNLLIESTGFTALDLVGEVLRGSTYIDRFHYRFQYPESIGDERLPAEFVRFLYPGDYTLRIRVTSSDGTHGGRTSQLIKVPSIGGEGALSKADLPDIPTSFALTGPDPDRAVTGYQVFTVPALPGIDKVAFFLDGTKVLTCNRPPFTVDLDLGEVPLPRSITAEGYDDRGQMKARDSIYLNAGVDRVSVHIVTPIPGDRAQLDTPFKAVVLTPEKDPPISLKIFLNDTLVSEIFQPPWELTLKPPLTGTTVVRALLETGSGKKVEDVSMLNAGSFGEIVRVNVVNLYVTVTSPTGRPVLDLGPSDFSVLEDSVPQVLEKVATAETIPLRVAVAVDTSSSMEKYLADVQGAARVFLQTVLKEKDEALVVDFDTRPRLVAPMTENRDLLFGSLTSLFADGSTALYDAVVYSLYQLQGSGRKAMVLLTDGKDTSSRYGFGETLDYARRAGVVIYPIALKVRFTEMIVRTKLIQLAEATGGRFISVEDPEDLPAVYEDIARELRSQYTLTYTSSARSREFRTVEVQVPKPNTARTIAGYYP